MRSDYNYTINGARGMCAAMVAIFHTWRGGLRGEIFPQPDSWAVFVLDSLQIGVPIFFMISGYVILGSLMRHMNAAGFLRDRFIRIYSAWVPALVAAAAVQFIFGIRGYAGDSSPGEAFWIFVANFFLLPPWLDVPRLNGVSWTLTCEWVFYLLAAFALVVRRNRIAPILLIGVIAAASTVHWYMLFFIPGVLTFLMESRTSRLALGSWSVVGLVALMCVFQMRYSSSLYGYAAVLIAFPVFVSFTTDAFSFLRTSVFQFLGKISYSLYLWHVLIIGTVRRFIAGRDIPGEGVIFATVCAVLSIAAAWISWRMFEVHMAGMLRKHFWAPRSGGTGGRVEVGSRGGTVSDSSP